MCGVQHCQNATSVPDDIPMDGVVVHALSVDRALFPSIDKRRVTTNRCEDACDTLVE
jgi:hypothetical protein